MSKMQWTWLGLLMMLVVSCRSGDIPQTELCISADTLVMGCDDPRLDTDNRSYPRRLAQGDHCTNSNDFVTLQKFVAELVEANKKLKRRLRRCR